MTVRYQKVYIVINPVTHFPPPKSILESPDAATGSLYCSCECSHSEGAAVLLRFGVILPPRPSRRYHSFILNTIADKKIKQ